MSHVAPIRIGPWEVEVICEGWAALPLADECPGQDVDWQGERERRRWAFVPGEEAWRWHVHAFVVRSPAATFLVDVGVGAFGPWAPWREHDADAWGDLDPTAVDHVLITHLHADHAGGAVSGREPRFPNARYHVHPADWRHFAGSSDYVAAEAMMPIAALGRLSLRADDHDPLPGVTLLHTPGHTPGHRSVLVRGGDDTLLITGDLLHLPIQADNPAWPSSHDEEPALGAHSRVAQLADAAAGSWSVAVNHFATPFGSIRERRWEGAPTTDDG